MVAVEDQSLTISTTTEVEEAPVTTTKEAAIVYFNGLIAYKSADQDMVEIGLTGNQFIQNAYTLLAEGTGLLRIDCPASICYCADLGITA